MGSLLLTVATTTRHHENHFSRQKSVEEAEQLDKEGEEACQDGAGQLPQRVLRGGDRGELAERVVGGQAGAGVGDGGALREDQPAAPGLVLRRQHRVRLPTSPASTWLSRLCGRRWRRTDKQRLFVARSSQGGLEVLRLGEEAKCIGGGSVQRSEGRGGCCQRKAEKKYMICVKILYEI